MKEGNAFPKYSLWPNSSRITESLQTWEIHWSTSSLDIQTKPDLRYLDPQNIPKTPNLRMYLDVCRVLMPFWFKWISRFLVDPCVYFRCWVVHMRKTLMFPAVLSSEVVQEDIHVLGLVPDQLRLLVEDGPIPLLELLNGISERIIFFQSWSLLVYIDGDFKDLGLFHPKSCGNDPIWGAYFSNGLVQPPTSGWYVWVNYRPKQ